MKTKFEIANKKLPTTPTFREALAKKIIFNYYGRKNTEDTMVWWIFTLITCGGYIGALFAKAAIDSKIKQFVSAIMGLIMTFLLNMIANLCFIFEI